MRSGDLRAFSLLLGATCAVVQGVAFRELAVTLRLEALGYGLVLACWLLCHASGTRLARSFEGRRETLRVAGGFLVVLLLLLCPVIRALPLLLSLPAGEILAPPFLVGASLVGLGAPVLLLGGLFALLLRCGERLGSEGAARRIYRWEVMGFTAGAILHRIALVFSLPPLTVTVFLSLFVLAMWDARGRRGRALASAFALAWIGLLLVVLLLGPRALEGVERASRQWRWAGQRLIAASSSPRGELAATRRSGQTAIWVNGQLAGIRPDAEEVELVAHLAAASVEAPRRILVVGSVRPDLPSELLRHPVERVELWEGNPSLVDFLDALPAQVWASGPAERIRRLPGGDRSLRKEGPWDLILIDGAAPATAGESRRTAVSFLRLLRKGLAPGGRLLLTLPFSASYMSAPMRALDVSVYKALHRVFPETRLLPGSPLVVLAGSDPGLSALDAETVLRRLQERGVRPRTLHPALLAERFSLPRLADALRHDAGTPIEREVSPAEEVTLALRAWEADPIPPNDLATPVSFRLTLELWLEIASPGWARFYASWRGLPLWLLALAAFLGVFLLSWGGGRTAALGLAVGGAGFVAMGVEIGAIALYESFMGHVLSEIVLLSSLFMVGTILGSGVSVPRGGAAILRCLTRQDLLLMVLSSALLIVPVLRIGGPLPFVLALAGGVVLAGAVVGARYVVAVAAVRGPEATEAVAGGRVMAWDLLGSMAGALVLPLFLLPVHGFAGLASLCFAVAAASLLGRRAGIIPGRRVAGCTP